MIPKHFEGIVTDIRETADSKVKGPNPWAGIIIHHTGLGDRDASKIDESLWRRMFDNVTEWMRKKDENYLSAHFHIGRFGECVMLANPDTSVTFHAGESNFFHPERREFATGWNAHAIGIELLGDGNRVDFSDEQYRALARLCAVLVKRYRMIDPRCITGHENLTSRKKDPGSKFEWMKFFTMLFDELRRLDVVSIARD